MDPGENPASYVRGIKEILTRTSKFMKETEDKEYWDKLRILVEMLYDDLEMMARPLKP